jgi:PIN domain nuclease of toxin-antitoxin system
LIHLDTHGWVWWLASPERLSGPAREVIAGAMEQREIYISSISSREIAILLNKRRLELTMPVEDWVTRRGASLPAVRRRRKWQNGRERRR